MKSARIIVAGVLAIGFVLALALVYTFKNRSSANTVKNDTPLDVSLPSHSLQEEAWATFKDMISKYPSEQPQWEKWEDKCKVDLEACPDGRVPKIEQLLSTEASNWKMNRTDEYLALTLLRDSVRLPVQLELNHSLDKATPQQFASVLFNKQAAVSVIDGEMKLNVDKPIKFLKGSMLAKVVWTVIPIDGGKNQPFFPMYVTKVMNPADEQNLSPNPFVAPPPPGNYWSQFSIDMSVKDASGGCRPETGVVPLNCIHQYSFPGGKGSSGANLIAAMEHEPVRQTFDAVNHICTTDTCMLALMGVHIMKRLTDDDPSTQGGKYPWLFITFWWTGQDNGQNLPEPWKYFQMNVTQLPRVDEAEAGKHNICFNPYLESVKVGGPQSNCVNCHTFAAWNPAKGHASPAPAGAGIKLGAAAIATPPSAKAVMDYKNQFRPTDFVWSMATFPGMTSGPPSKSNSVKALPVDR
jgi:hypothetical protein